MRVWAIVMMLTVAGCGGAATTKTDVSEQEKQQQLKDLDSQRQDEWGRKK